MCTLNMETVLVGLFGSEEVVRKSIAEAKKGAEMLMRFKEKKAAKGIATIYLRLLENGKYLPLLCVTNLNGDEVFHADLPETIDLNIIGEIQLSSKKVTVKPRKNALSKGLEPISFDV